MSGGEQLDLLDDPDALEAFLNDDTFLMPVSANQQFDVAASPAAVGQAQASASANSSFSKPVQIVQPTVQQAPRTSHTTNTAQLGSVKAPTGASGGAEGGSGSAAAGGASASAVLCSPGKAAGGGTAGMATALVQQNVNIMNISLQPATGGAAAGGQTHTMQLPMMQMPVSVAGGGGGLASGPTAAFSLIQVPNGQLILQQIMPSANLQLVTLGPSSLGVAMSGGAQSAGFVGVPSQSADATRTVAGLKARVMSSASVARPAAKASAETSGVLRPGASSQRPATPASASRAAQKRPGNAIVVTNYSKQSKRPAPAAPAPAPSKATSSGNSPPKSSQIVNKQHAVWRDAVQRQMNAMEKLTPFANADDALERLVAYHLYQESERHSDTSAFASWPLLISNPRARAACEKAERQFDETFEKTCESLSQRCGALFAWWSHMEAKDSYYDESVSGKCEQLLLEQLELDELREMFEREKRGEVLPPIEPPKFEDAEPCDNIKCEPEPELELQPEMQASAIDEEPLHGGESGDFNLQNDIEMAHEASERKKKKKKKKRKERLERLEQMGQDGRFDGDATAVENKFVSSITSEPNRIKLVIRMKAPSDAQMQAVEAAQPAVEHAEEQLEGDAQADEETRAAAEHLLMND